MKVSIKKERREMTELVMLGRYDRKAMNIYHTINNTTIGKKRNKPRGQNANI